MTQLNQVERYQQLVAQKHLSGLNALEEQELEQLLFKIDTGDEQFYRQVLEGAEKALNKAQLMVILGHILSDKRYIEGVKYGVPRTGHAEGSVENHIQMLLETLKKIRPLLSDEEVLKLMILVHVHDCMKLYAKRDTPILHNESHSTLARKFLAEFTDDADLLQMVQLHDENFALWMNFRKKGVLKQERFLKCVNSIKDIELYLLFTILDGFTPSKEHQRIRWFIDLVNSQGRETPRVYKALEMLGI